jgi:drug/metabolite transporter (DMT)-like permease
LTLHLLGLTRDFYTGIDLNLRRHSASNWIMLLSLTAMWGSAFMLTEIAVTGLPSSLVVAGRLTVAWLLLLLTAVAVTRRLPTGRRLWLFCLLIAFFGNALPFSLISWGRWWSA